VGSFAVTVSWKGMQKTCNIAYNIDRAPDKCGNNHIDEGENCVTCPADAGCNPLRGESCDNNPQSDTFGACIVPILPPDDGGGAGFNPLWYLVGGLLTAGSAMVGYGYFKGVA
jgi:hypothetical protein